MKDNLSARQQIQNYIVKRVMEDKTVLDRITKNPNETIKQLISELDSINPELKYFLKNLNFKIYKENQDELMFVLPYVTTSKTQVPKDQLKKLAVGDCACCWHT